MSKLDDPMEAFKAEAIKALDISELEEHPSLVGSLVGILSAAAQTLADAKVEANNKRAARMLEKVQHSFDIEDFTRGYREALIQFINKEDLQPTARDGEE